MVVGVEKVEKSKSRKVEKSKSQSRKVEKSETSERANEERFCFVNCFFINQVNQRINVRACVRWKCTV